MFSFNFRFVLLTASLLTLVFAFNKKNPVIKYDCKSVASNREFKMNRYEIKKLYEQEFYRKLYQCDIDQIKYVIPN